MKNIVNRVFHFFYDDFIRPYTILKIVYFPADDHRNPLWRDHDRKMEYYDRIDEIYNRLYAEKVNELRTDHEPDEVEEQISNYRGILRQRAEIIYWSETNPECDDTMNIGKMKVGMDKETFSVEDITPWFTVRAVLYGLVIVCFLIWAFTQIGLLFI